MTPRDPKRFHYRKFPTQYTIYLPLETRLYWPHGVPCLFNPVSFHFFISQRIVTLQDVIISDNLPLIRPWEPVFTDPAVLFTPPVSYFVFIGKRSFEELFLTLQDVITTMQHLFTPGNQSLLTPRFPCLLPFIIQRTTRDSTRCFHHKSPTLSTINSPSGTCIHWPHGVPCLFYPLPGLPSIPCHESTPVVL